MGTNAEVDPFMSAVEERSTDRGSRTIVTGHNGADSAALAQLENVSVAYDLKHVKQPPALVNVSLAMQPRETVALIGPSGCGKSTCLRLLSGLLQPTSGTVRVGSTSDASSGGISVMFQTPALLDWRSVLSNIALPLESRGVRKKDALDRAAEILDLVGLSALSSRHPYELSGGQQQRVALARALVTEPDLLLLDEPFGALDAITRDKLQVELQNICAGRSMSTVLVTHSVSEAIFLADRILVMESHPGRISEEIDVPFDRPRKLSDRTTPEAQALEAHLLEALVH
jgi:NitT/TauT family transport system ATP-binding protein